MDNIEIRIDEKWLEHAGDHSLLGQLSEKTGHALASLKRVTLIFPVTPLYSTITVPCYAMPCLIESILQLKALGVDVQILRVLPPLPIQG